MGSLLGLTLANISMGYIELNVTSKFTTIIKISSSPSEANN